MQGFENCKVKSPAIPRPLGGWEYKTLLGLLQPSRGGVFGAVLYITFPGELTHDAGFFVALTFFYRIQNCAVCEN